MLLCCCAVLHCCVTVVGTVFELQHEWSHHWVDTLSCNPSVTTPSCYCGLLHCCAALLCCTAVLYCCVVVLCCTVAFCPAASSSYNTELLHRWVDTLSCNPTVTTPSCHPVVRPHSQHRKVALRGTEVVTSHRSKTGHRPTNRIQSVARERVTVGF